MLFNSVKRRAIYDQYDDAGLRTGVPIGQRSISFWKKKSSSVCISGPDAEWSEGYVFHNDANQTFRDFFGGDNPFAGMSLAPTENLHQPYFRVLCQC